MRLTADKTVLEINLIAIVFLVLMLPITVHFIEKNLTGSLFPATSQYYCGGEARDTE
jgi:predicted cation transporter